MTLLQPPDPTRPVKSLRWLLMGAEARALGHGGIRMVARAAGVREATVSLAWTSWIPGRAAGPGAAAGRWPQAGR
jgi:hypothetical protein